VFETEELALARVDDRIRGLTWDEIGSSETSRFLAQIEAPLEQAVAIWVADAQGVIRAGSRPWDPPMTIAERDFFRVQREHDAGTYVSAAFEGRATRTASFAVSRRRSTPDGHFDGTVYIALSPQYFARFFAEAAPRLMYAAALVRSDGEVLTRVPYRENGTRLRPDGALMRQIALRPEGGFYSGKSRFDGVERMFAYRKVGAYPVYVRFGVETASLLRRWHQNLLLFGLTAGGASLLLLLMSWLALRGMKAERAALAQLRMALSELERETIQREAAEQRVRQAQKMEAVGQLTGGIAHDFNNLLMAVLGNLQLLRKHLPAGDGRSARLLENAERGAQRGAALTQRLLAFGRRQALKPEAVELPTLVRGMSDLLRSSLGVGIQVETFFPVGLAPIHVDANQLELALLNLATNARDAMAGNGRLIITAREEPGDPETVPATAGAHVVLSVTDTGVGMDEATLARAIDPFFTTKGIGKGTGLGLSMVHGLAAQSGGKLLLRSAPGKGTTAELWLPRAKTAGLPVAPPPIAEAGEPCPGSVRHRTVLMVDDDPLVLASTAAMLEDLGHSAVEAASGRQALEILRAGAKVDLVVTDQSMPGMTGTQLAGELRRLRPGLPVLLATGYVERAEVAAAGLPILAKPFDQAMLMAAIRACLNVPSTTRGRVIPFRAQ
jgi:signal transduction histidine kinase/CheY-like chemotaxis protein